MNGSQSVYHLIMSSPQTVFRLQDIVLLTRDSDTISLIKKLNYQVKNGRLLNPRKGIYTKLQFNSEELACQIVSPCYLSFEYVLQKAGIVFQYDSRFQLASYLSREIQIGSLSFVFKKLKREILLNPLGIIHHEIRTEATPERAFLDVLYLNKTYYVDQFDKLNKDKLLELSAIYDSKRLTKQIKELVYG